MNDMFRRSLGVMAGLAAAAAVVAIGETIGHTIFPPPDGIDLADPRAVQTLIASLPTGAILAVLAAWTAGSLAGGAVAAYVARWRGATLLVGLAMLAAATATMLVIPHPVWFMAASVPAAVLPAWVAARFVA
jgi:ribose/xylose/arabinose/galactoside ABC-type transport system permease subunit